MSLRKKLFLLFAPLFIFIFLLMSYIFYHDYKNFISLKEIEGRLNTQKIISKLIHQVQIERGKSNLYLNKKITEKEFSTQKQNVDKIKKELAENIASLNVVTIKNDFENANTLLEKARDNITQNKNFKEAFGLFVASVSEYLKLQINIYEDLHFQGLEAENKSLTILEESKENMAKLRGVLNGIFASNTIKEIKDRDTLNQYFVSIIVNLNSPALFIREDSLKSVKNILNSDEWKSIEKDFQIFNNKFTTGDYGVDPKIFFETMSKQINLVNDILVSEQNFKLNKIQFNINKIKRSNLIILLTISVSMILVIIFILVFLNRLEKEISAIVLNLSDSILSFTQASDSLIKNAKILSSNAEEEAASLQETSSTTEEIKSMIELTTSKLEQTTNISDEAIELAATGNLLIKEVNSAILDIDTNNKIFTKEIQNTNKEISEILNIVKMIESKTHIINDIVFQTKLLSFNASVEAARAGEHGKGFAVVAEEVGKLAALSGTASKEIAELLADSTKSVETIVSKSQKNIDELIKTYEHKISKSINVSDQCEENFLNIQNKIQNISGQTNDISQANKEQSKGVSEINLAINQIEKASISNSDLALLTLQNANELNQNAQNMKLAVDSLVKITKG